MHDQLRHIGARLTNFLLITSFAMLATAEEPTRLARLPDHSGTRASEQPTHPIDPALKIAVDSLDHVRQNVDDYSAIFVKRCRVNGELPPLCFAKLKIRNRKTVDDVVETPMSVYLDFLKPSSVKGREVIWVEGQNDGDMIVHQGGYASFLTTRIDPEGMLAMRGQRYSIKQIGIENLLIKVIEIGRRDRRYGECVVDIDPEGKFGEVNCTVIDITHPIERDHFRFHRARLYFDNELKLPIRYQAWMWPENAGEEPPLDEEYNYFKLAVNNGMGDEDFDESNPDYRFR